MLLRLKNKLILTKFIISFKVSAMKEKIIRKELESRLIEQAMKNPGFRKQLMDNPREVLAKELGVSLPESITVKVLEEKIDEIYLVLPGLSIHEEELSEKDLETVAGGWTGGTECGTCLEDGCTYSCDDSKC